MKTFTVKCNNCGAETTFSIGNGISPDKDNDNIDVGGDYGGAPEFACKCGNEVWA